MATVSSFEVIAGVLLDRGLKPTTAAIDSLLRINQIGAGLKHVANNWLILWGTCFTLFSGGLLGRTEN